MILKVGRNKLTVKGAGDTEITLSEDGTTKTFNSGMIYDEEKISATIPAKYRSSRQQTIFDATITNIELLSKAAQSGKTIVMSTGMSTWDEIDHAVDIFRKANCPFELMHCNSTYPMPIEDANLNLIKTLQNRFGCNVGYSGHESDILVSTCAVAMGATSIERHITLDRNMYGSDQKASIEPYELCALVRNIRNVEKMLGTGVKILSSAEETVKKKLRG